jgi:hypothetical protein
MPADGTGAAAKREFGTSGWQLGGEATSTARPAQNAFQAFLLNADEVIE